MTFLFDYLIKEGLRHVTLCTGYLGEQIQAVYGDTYGPLRLAYSQESSPLGTAGALRLAEPLFGSDSIFVMNGDSICCADFMDFWMWQGERNADASLFLTRVSDARHFVSKQAGDG